MKFVLHNRVLFFMIFLLSGMANAQPSEGKVLDKIVAVVGNKIVLHSDIENQYEEYIRSGMPVDKETRCLIFEETLLQKLMLNQAELDSITVPEEQIQSEMERRIRYFVAQIGSEKKLEEFYQKSIVEIKAEFHDLIRDQLMIQQMQGKITTDVKVTPAEIKKYFERIPEDSLPYINSKIEIAHIVSKPPISETEKEIAMAKLQGIKERIEKGEDFGTLAYLYSEDPGSAQKNGELGFTPRNALVPEFSSAAFNLQPNQISEIVETEFGFHLIQLIERRGEEANIRHILITPKVNPMDLIKAKNKLDSIKLLLESVDTLTFDIAAEEFSDDEETKHNGGKVINYSTGTTQFQMDELGKLDPTLAFSINKMEVGDVSRPMVMQMQDGSTSYRIVKLVKRTAPHRANLIDDYQQFQELALMEKQTLKLMEWVADKAQKSYLRIEPEFQNCELSNNWGLKQ